MAKKSNEELRKRYSRVASGKDETQAMSKETGSATTADRLRARYATRDQYNTYTSANRTPSRYNGSAVLNYMDAYNLTNQRRAKRQELAEKKRFMDRQQELVRNGYDNGNNPLGLKNLQNPLDDMRRLEAFKEAYGKNHVLSFNDAQKMEKAYGNADRKQLEQLKEHYQTAKDRDYSGELEWVNDKLISTATGEQNERRQSILNSKIKDADKRLERLYNLYAKKSMDNEINNDDPFNDVNVKNNPLQSEEYQAKKDAIEKEKAAYKDELNAYKESIDYKTSDDFEKYKEKGKNDTSNKIEFYRNNSDENIDAFWNNFDNTTSTTDTRTGITYTGVPIYKRSDLDFVRAITDEEADNYNYILGKYGKDKAEDYLQSIAKHTDVNGAITKMQKAAEQGKKNPVLATAESIGLGLVTPLEALKNITGFGGEYRTYDDYALAGRQEALRSGVNEAIQNTNLPGSENVLPFLYNTANSTADNLLRYAVGGSVGAASNSAGAAKGAMRLMMAGQVGDSAMKSALDRGLTDSQAVTTAIISAINEELFETISLERLDAMKAASPKQFRDIAKNVGKQILAEGSEEVFTDIGNAIADDLVNGEKSEIAQNIKNYMSQGLSEEEAKKKASVDFALQLVESGLAGGLSGATMGGVETVRQINTLNNQNMYDDIAQSYINAGMSEVDAYDAAYNDVTAGLENKYDNEGNVVEQTGLKKSLRNAVKSAAELNENIQNLETQMKAGVEPTTPISDADIRGNKENIRLSKADNEYLNEVGKLLDYDLSTKEGALKFIEAQDKLVEKYPERRQQITKTTSSVATQGQDKATALNDLRNELTNTMPTNETSLESQINASQGNTVNRQNIEVPQKAEFKATIDGEEKTIKAVNNGKIIVQDNNGREQTVNIREAELTDGASAAVEQAKKYGARGSRLYLDNLSSDNLRNYTLAFNTFYNAGKNGKTFYGNKTLGVDTSLLIEAYAAGVADNSKKSEVGGLIRNEARYKIKESEARVLDTMGKKFGVTIQIDNMLSNDANGLYQDGIIHISANAENPALVVFSHEFTHRLEETSPEAYKEYENFVIDYLKEQGLYDSRAESLKNLYARAGVKLSEKDIRSEIAANATESFLTDADLIESVVNENKSLAQKIIDTIKSMIDDLKDALSGYRNPKSTEAQAIRNGIGTFEKALELWINAAENQTNLDEKSNSDVKYLIRNKDALSLENMQNNYTDIALNDKAIVLDHPYKRFNKMSDTMNYLDSVMSEYNNKLYNKDLDSEIIFDNESKKDLKKHNISRKFKFFDVLPEIIEKGKPIQYIKNRKGDGRNYITIAAPVKFDINMGSYKIEKEFFVGVSLVENLVDNKLHMVAVEDMSGNNLIEGYENDLYSSTPSLENPISALLSSSDDSYPSINSLLKHLARIKLQNENDTSTKKDYNNFKSTEKYSLKEDSEGNKLSPQQQKYFKDSKAVDDEGNLQVVYHGTVSDFTIFDREYGNAEGDFGKGFYFTNNIGDVENNYANEKGPDLKIKIEQYAERLQADEDMDEDEAMEAARKHFIKSDAHYIESYLNIKNPVIISDEYETYILDDIADYIGIDIEDYEDEDDYYAEYDDAVNDFISEMISDIEYQFEDVYNIEEVGTVLSEAAYDGGIKVNDLKEKINNLYLEGEEGLVSNEVTRYILEYLEYDGIIDKTVSEKFKNMHLSPDTVHYIVFNSNQAKRVDNTNPTENADIRYSLKDNLDKFNIDTTPLLNEIKDNVDYNKWVKSNLSNNNFMKYGRNNSIYFVRNLWYEKRRQEELKDVHEISIEDAIKTVRNAIPNNHSRLWFVEANSNIKPTIVNEILSNKGTLNAGLNIAYYNYKNSNNNKNILSFNDWLNTPQTMYRGKNEKQKYIEDDVFISFTPNKKIANKFNKNLKKITIKPIDTYGSYQTTAEEEFLVPIKEVINNSNDNVKFSLKEDSEGNKLSKEQQEFFKDSKAVDDEGNLLVMYHGTENSGFTVFDKDYFNSAEGFFFTNRLSTAKGYSATEDIINLPKINSIKDFENEVNKQFNNTDIKVKKNGNTFELYEVDNDYEDYIDEADNLSDLYVKYLEYKGDIGYSYNYKVYLNVKNPLIVDAKGEFWDKIKTDFSKDTMTTNELVDYARKNNYDGLIVKNVLDNALYNTSEEFYKPGIDIVAFDSNQIKSVDNKKPTDNPDIRFSLKEESNITRNDVAALTGKDPYMAEAVKDLEDIMRMKGGEAFFKANQKELYKIYDEIAEEYNIKDYSKKRFADNVKELFDYIQSVDNPDGVDTTMLAMQIADDMLDKGSIKDTSMEELYPTLQQQLRDYKIKIADQDKADLDGGYNAFRKKYFGSLTLSNDGTEVDSVYEDLASSYPELFPEDITHPGDRLTRIADVADMFRKTVDHIEGATRNESAFIIAQDIINKAVLEQTKNDKSIDNKKRLKAQEKVRKQNTNLKKAKKDIHDEYARLQRKVKALEYTKDRLSKKLEKAENELGRQKKEFADWAAGKRQVNKEDKYYKQKYDKLMQEFSKKKVAEMQKKYSNERRKNIEKIRKMVNTLDRSVRKPDKKHYVPKYLVNSMLDVLRTIDLDSGYRKPDGSETLVYMKLKEMQKQYKEMQNDMDYAIASEYNETIDKAIGRLAEITKGRRINELLDKDIADIVEIMEVLTYQMKTARDLLENEKLSDIKEASQKAREQIKEAGRTFNTDAKLKNLFNRYLNNSLSPVRVMRRLEGYAHDGVLSSLGEELQQGERKTKFIRQKANAMLDELYKDTKAIKALEKFRSEKLTYNIGGKNIILTPDMRAAIYLHSLNEQNMKHVVGNKTKEGSYRGGGIIIPNYQKQMKFNNRDSVKVNAAEKYTGQDAVRLSESDVQRIIADMTEYDKRIVELYQQVNEYLTKELNDTTMNLYGFKKATVKNYFPLIVDKSILNLDSDALKFDKTLESFGFLKERVNSAKPIYLEGVMDALERQIDQSSLFSGMAIPSRDFKKVWNYAAMDENDKFDNVNKQAQKAMGSYIDKYVGNLQADLAQARERGDNLALLSAFSRGKMAMSALTGNLSVVLKQAASYPTAAGGVLGYQDLLAGLTPKGQRGKTLEKTMNKYTPLYQDRNTATITGVNINDMNLLKRRNPKLYYALTGWIESMDKATVRRLWYASENYVKRNFNYEVGSDDYYEEVAKVWEDTIRRTQPIYDTMSRPEFLRTTSDIGKFLMMFKTQALQNVGIMVENYGELKARKRDYEKDKSDYNLKELKNAQWQFRKAVSSQIIQSIIFTGITALVDAFIKHRPDKWADEETGIITPESLWDNFIKAWTDNVIGQLAFGDIIRDLGYYPVKTLITGKEQKRFDLSIPPVDAINDIITSTNKIANAVANRDLKKAIYYNKQLRTTAAQYGFGIPVNNIENLYKGLEGNIRDIAAGKNPLEQSTDKQMYNRIYLAYQSGNPEVAKELSKDLDPDKVKTKMVSKLKEEDTIKEAADYRYNSELDKYQAIVDAYVSLGFDEDWVTSAISNVMNKEHDTTGSGEYNSNDLQRAIDISAVKGSKVAQQIYDEKYATYKADGLKDADAKKKALSSVKSAITDKYKPQYESGTTSQKVSIRDRLCSLRVAGERLYTYDSMKNWNK